MDLLLENVPEELAKQLLDKDFAEVAVRNAKQRFKEFFKFAVKQVEKSADKKKIGEKIHKVVKQKDLLNMKEMANNLNQMFNVLQNTQILGILSSALSAAGLVATIAGIAIICDQLNGIDKKLDDIKKNINDHKKMNFETDINKPCRMLVADYKLIGKKIEDGDPVTEKEVSTLIRDCHEYIITLYNLRDVCSLDAVLGLIFTLLPIFANCILIYYNRFYDHDRGVHALHNDWMNTFDLLGDESFLHQIQDYMFIDLHQTNRQVNEYIDCQKMILFSYKQKIEQLIEDLEACKGLEGYNAAMQWSRQYAAQQARVVQADLETRYGKEEAQNIMAQALQEALA